MGSFWIEEPPETSEERVEEIVAGDRMRQLSAVLTLAIFAVGAVVFLCVAWLIS